MLLTLQRILRLTMRDYSQIKPPSSYRRSWPAKPLMEQQTLNRRNSIDLPPKSVRRSWAEEEKPLVEQPKLKPNFDRLNSSCSSIDLPPTPPKRTKSLNKHAIASVSFRKMLLELETKVKVDESTTPYVFPTQTLKNLVTQETDYDIPTYSQHDLSSSIRSSSSNVNNDDDWAQLDLDWINDDDLTATTTKTGKSSHYRKSCQSLQSFSNFDDSSSIGFDEMSASVRSLRDPSKSKRKKSKAKMTRMKETDGSDGCARRPRRPKSLRKLKSCRRLEVTKDESKVIEGTEETPPLGLRRIQSVPQPSRRSVPTSIKIEKNKIMKRLPSLPPQKPPSGRFRGRDNSNSPTGIKERLTKLFSLPKDRPIVGRGGRPKLTRQKSSKALTSVDGRARRRF